MDNTTTSSITGDTNSALSMITPLDSTNYHQWSFSMKFLLDGEDLWELVINDTEQQTSTTQGAQTRNRTRTLSPGPAIDETKRRKCKIAAYLIYQSCSALPQSYIAHEKDPSTMWTILQKLYSRTNDDETGQTLFEEFWTEQFQKYKTIEEYGAKLKSYQYQLAGITERRLTDGNLIVQLIKGLPQQYDDIATSIRLNKSTIDFHQALTLLTEHERTISARRQSKALVVKALVADTHNARNSNRSRNHHQTGKPHAHNNRISKPTKYWYQCGKANHVARDCRIRMEGLRRKAEDEAETASVNVAEASTASANTAITFNPDLYILDEDSVYNE